MDVSLTVWGPARIREDQEVKLRLESITCNECSSSITSDAHKVDCITKITENGSYRRTIYSLMSDTSPLDFSAGLKNAILNLKLSNGVTYYPNSGFRSLLVGTSIKEFCSNCNLFVVSDGHAARCTTRRAQVNTDLRVGSSTKWTAERRRAWVGDAIHRADIRIAALIRGVPDIDKSKFELSYVDAKAQTKYLRDFYSNDIPLLNLSDHSVSTMFESRYFTEFRRAYLSRSFGTTSATVIMSSLEETYSSEVFESLDSTTE